MDDQDKLHAQADYTSNYEQGVRIKHEGQQEERKKEKSFGLEIPHEMTATGASYIVLGMALLGQQHVSIFLGQRNISKVDRIGSHSC